VRTTVVRDVVRRADGTLAEKTRDWYAADNHGTVWYFGEQTATYRHDGSVESREGSWQAGVDGARAGRIMPADPHPTQAYRQESVAAMPRTRRGSSRTTPVERFGPGPITTWCAAWSGPDSSLAWSR
jgi:hypothetical protein